MPTYKVKVGRTAEYIQAESVAAALAQSQARPGDVVEVEEVPSVRGLVIEWAVREAFERG